MLFPTRPPIPIPGKKELALLMAGGAIACGKYLWQKWKEQKMNTMTQGTIFDEPGAFGTMESQSGQEISLKSISLNGALSGLLFTSKITQEYKNETAEDLEIIYTFPVGYNTALLGMEAMLGDKKLQGEVVKKAEAEEKYEQAITDGDAAIMVQESSLGLYTANLGNIKPGETVSVSIHCAKMLSFEQDGIRLAIPTVIGERYGDPHAAGGLAAHESAKVDKNAKYDFSLKIAIKGDLQPEQVECPTHKVQIEQNANEIDVRLDADAFLDRDFVLLIKNIKGQSFAQYAQDEDKWLACASFYPQMDDIENNPLGLKILVDCSGSMSGVSIAQAQMGLQKILTLLKPDDYVSYSRFGSKYEHLSKELLPCNSDNLARLNRAIAMTYADMGGTEMEKAVLATVNDIKNTGDAPAAILLITDGDIWEVKNLIESAKKTGHRIFVIGVGSAPAESVLMELARQTGGVCEFVTPNENMAEAIVRMFHRMRCKAVKNIRMDWKQQPIWQSNLPNFIYDGETVRSFALFDARPESGPALSWQADGKDFVCKIEAASETSDADIVKLGRRTQMRQCLSKEEKIAIALKYQLVSKYTSLILVYERSEEEKAKGMPAIQQVPQMRAHGHGNYGASTLNHGMAAFCFANEFTGSPLMSKVWDSTPPFDFISKLINKKFDLEKALQNLLELWRNNLYSLTDFSDFITLLITDKSFKKFADIVMNAAKSCSVSTATVWAVLVETELAKNNALDRHSLRLLKPVLPEEAEKEAIRNRVGQEATPKLPDFFKPYMN